MKLCQSPIFTESKDEIINPTFKNQLWSTQFQMNMSLQLGLSEGATSSREIGQKEEDAQKKDEGRCTQAQALTFTNIPSTRSPCSLALIPKLLHALRMDESCSTALLLLLEAWDPPFAAVQCVLAKAHMEPFGRETFAEVDHWLMISGIFHCPAWLRTGGWCHPFFHGHDFHCHSDMGKKEREKPKEQPRGAFEFFTATRRQTEMEADKKNVGWFGYFVAWKLNITILLRLVSDVQMVASVATVWRTDCQE